VTSWFRPAIVSGLAALSSFVLAGCAGVGVSTPLHRSEAPLTASRALGQGDATRDASLRLVIAGLDEDEAGRPSRAVASYQRAIRVDSTNPFPYLALARHHLEYGSVGEASAFLEQSRALFEAEGRLGPDVDVWGLGLRAWIDRGMGRESAADARFDAARELSPEIWADELLSADEMR
jgi:tetratricopeptide (TPR) repeat protein